MMIYWARLLAALALTLGLASASLSGNTHSTEIVLVNLTGGDLHLVSAIADNNTHWDIKPPHTITNNEASSFKMNTHMLFYGCKGGATYKTDSGGTIHVKVDNTFASGNRFYKQVSNVPPMSPPDGHDQPQPLCINVYGPAHGNFISATFIVSWQDMDASAGNINWNQVNQKVSDSYKQLEKCPAGK